MDSQTFSIQSPSEGGKGKTFKNWQESVFHQIGEKDTDLRAFTKTKKGLKFSAYVRSTSYITVISQAKGYFKVVSSKETIDSLKVLFSEIKIFLLIFLRKS